MSAEETSSSSNCTSRQKRDRMMTGNTGQEKNTEETEGENLDSAAASDNNDSGGGAGPKTKKRPRDGGGGLKKEEQLMNDSSLPAAPAPKESSEEGKEGDGAMGGRTCVSCRKSKVKCSKGSPCKRCSRLKLECVAQVRGRGRPVASGGVSAGAKKSARPEGTKGVGNGGVDAGVGVGGGGSGVGGSGIGGARDSSCPSSSGKSSSGSSFLGRRGSGVLSSGVLSTSSPSAFGGAGSEGLASVGSGSTSLGSSNTADARDSFGFSSSTAGVAPPPITTGMSCPPPLGFNGPCRGLSVADDVAALGGGLGGGGGGGGSGGDGYGHQDFDPSSRPFPPHLLSSGRPLPSAPSAAAAAAQHAQHQQQQGAPHGGSFPAARTPFTHPLLHGGSAGSSGASDGAPGWMANAPGGPGRPPMTSAARRASINSGGSWRAVFHGEDVGTGSRAKGSSSLSSDGGFGGFGGKDLAWAETMDEHKDAVAAAAAAADGEEFVSRSTDDRARWLMDVEQYAVAPGADSAGRLPEADEGGVDPTDTIVTGFWKLFSEQEVHRPKAVLVIRHWALCALERRSTHLMRNTVDMARALCINVAEILNDYGIYAMFHELLREAEAGNTIEPARPVKLGHQEAPPYIRELSSQFAAVSTRVVLRGQSNFVHNEMCAHLFMSTEQANELYASNTQDVWATCIHPDDHKTFFDSISIELFRAPGHKSEFTKICKCREHTGTVFLALVHFRYEFQDEGNYAAYGLSILPLPESDYLQKAERPPPPPENGHEGAAAAVAALSGPSSTDSGAATATKLCDAFLPGQASSVRSSVASTASSLSGVGPAASAGGARRGSGGDDFPGGGGGGDYQPLPPLGVMHQRVGSFHLQGRVDAWGSHDMGGAVSVGDVAKGLDGSLNSSRGSVPGGGDGFQDGIGGGGLILDSGRGGLSSGWGKASSAGR